MTAKKRGVNDLLETARKLEQLCDALEWVLSVRLKDGASRISDERVKELKTLLRKASKVLEKEDCPECDGRGMVPCDPEMGMDEAGCAWCIGTGKVQPGRPRGPNLRDYGLPDSEVTGIPVATPMKATPPCPNCGCKTLMSIEVEVTQALVGGPGISTYVGCPACPWASPAMVRRKSVEAQEEVKE